MYHCDNCGRTFKETVTLTEETGVKVDGVKEVLTFETCPHCGNEMIRTADECPLCGEWETDKVPRENYCLDCYNEMKDLLKLAFNNFANKHKDADDNDMWELVAIIIEREA